MFIFADGKNLSEDEKYDNFLKYEIIRYRGLKIIRKRRKSIDIENIFYIQGFVSSTRTKQHLLDRTHD